jgi:nicotinamide mononucleotide (NMN) deamidase PncC
MWETKFKEANISLHVITTGAGSGLQQLLWSVPGSSAYLSGASFPYEPEEQKELLGFTPEQYCCENAAVDLASAAYMKAYRLGGKSPIGLGLTASVASEKVHRGDHKIHVCVMTDTKVKSYYAILPKHVGKIQRSFDDKECTYAAMDLLEAAIINEDDLNKYVDSTALARGRFFERSFFSAAGKRSNLSIPFSKRYALMPGAYNPPHEGHLGTAEQVRDEYNRSVIFEVTAEPPHKDHLTVQQLLQRAKLLQGHDRLFTRHYPFYLDKAAAYPGVPLVLGADAMVRLFDPKWGLDIADMFVKFHNLDTKLLVAGRLIGDKFVTRDDILQDLKAKLSYGDWILAGNIMKAVSGRHDISSTELRNKTA